MSVETYGAICNYEVIESQIKMPHLLITDLIKKDILATALSQVVHVCFHTVQAEPLL